MEIKGKYYIDENFVNIYSSNRLYTIARNGGAWGSRAVGDSCGNGFIFTQELYNEGLKKCTKEGTFELRD